MKGNGEGGPELSSGASEPSMHEFYQGLQRFGIAPRLFCLVSLNSTRSEMRRDLVAPASSCRRNKTFVQHALKCVDGSQILNLSNEIRRQSDKTELSLDPQTFFCGCGGGGGGQGVVVVAEKWESRFCYLIRW